MRSSRVATFRERVLELLEQWEDEEAYIHIEETAAVSLLMCHVTHAYQLSFFNSPISID